MHHRPSHQILHTLFIRMFHENVLVEKKRKEEEEEEKTTCTYVRAALACTHTTFCYSIHPRGRN